MSLFIWDQSYVGFIEYKVIEFSMQLAIVAGDRLLSLTPGHQCLTPTISKNRYCQRHNEPSLLVDAFV